MRTSWITSAQHRIQWRPCWSGTPVRVNQGCAKLHVSQSIVLGTTRVQDPGCIAQQDCKDMQRYAKIKYNGGICKEFNGGLTFLSESPCTKHGRTAEYCIISRCWETKCTSTAYKETWHEMTLCLAMKWDIFCGISISTTFHARSMQSMQSLLPWSSHWVTESPAYPIRAAQTRGVHLRCLESLKARRESWQNESKW